MQKKDFTHHNKRRAFFHDYRQAAIYHITLNKSKEAPLFGKLKGDCHITPGEAGSAYIEPDTLGRIIINSIHSLPLHHNIIQIYQYIIMPDHVHILIRLTEYSTKALGYYIGNLTGAVTRQWRALTNAEYSVFEKGYNDRIIGPSRSLDVLFRYIRENPHRLAVRREHPEYFRRVNNLQICGNNYAAYGNMFLLSCPFKDFVVVHRRDSEAELASKHERWLYTAANGGVLVSPFISPAEKAIRTEAEALGARIILISNTEMGERYKPSGHDFELCEAGRLLIISVPSANLSRDHCLAMNSLAESIAGE